MCQHLRVLTKHFSTNWSFRPQILMISNKFRNTIESCVFSWVTWNEWKNCRPKMCLHLRVLTKLFSTNWIFRPQILMIPNKFRNTIESCVFSWITWNEWKNCRPKMCLHVRVMTNHFSTNWTFRPQILMIPNNFRNSTKSCVFSWVTWNEWKNCWPKMCLHLRVLTKLFSTNWTFRPQILMIQNNFRNTTKSCVFSWVTWNEWKNFGQKCVYICEFWPNCFLQIELFDPKSWWFRTISGILPKVVSFLE
jgi:pterin-4a-carbinolamine dehydratase